MCRIRPILLLILLYVSLFFVPANAQRLYQTSGAVQSSSVSSSLSISPPQVVRSTGISSVQGSSQFGAQSKTLYFGQGANLSFAPSANVYQPFIQSLPVQSTGRMRRVTQDGDDDDDDDFGSGGAGGGTNAGDGGQQANTFPVGSPLCLVLMLAVYLMAKRKKERARGREAIGKSEK